MHHPAGLLIDFASPLCLCPPFTVGCHDTHVLYRQRFPLQDPSTITAQTRQEQPRMGSLRLQVVRFLETLVGMDNPSMDQVLIQEVSGGRPRRRRAVVVVEFFLCCVRCCLYVTVAGGSLACTPPLFMFPAAWFSA